MTLFSLLLLQKVLDFQNKELANDIKKLHELKFVHDSILPADKPVVNTDIGNKVRMEQQAKGDMSVPKNHPAKVYEVKKVSEVKIAEDVCTWSKSAKAQTDIRVLYFHSMLLIDYIVIYTLPINFWFL